MATRDVKGLHRVVSKGREYWYAWRGAAPLGFMAPMARRTFGPRTMRQFASGTFRSRGNSARW